MSRGAEFGRPVRHFQVLSFRGAREMSKDALRTWNLVGFAVHVALIIVSDLEWQARS